MKRLFYFAAALPLLLTSCNKEDVTSDYDNTPVPLSVNATIGISSESISRSLVTGAAFGEESDIGIFITGTGYTPKVTIYTFDGSAWNLKPDPVQSPIYLNSKATVYGFYPVTEPSSGSPITANTTDKTIPVTVASSYNAIATDVPDNQADYLYATDGTNATTMAEVSKSDPNASLKFYHALSQLSFVINKGENFSGTGTLTSLTVAAETSNITGTGTLKLNGTGIELSGSLSKSITLTGSTTINAYNVTPSTNVIATALVAPLATKQEVTLTMKIDGQDYTGTISNAEWAAGSNYIYTVTVGSGTLTITSVSIQGWVNVGSGSVTVE